ncbi:MAG TPA: energy transducer TonB, partial [Polyangiaceae bacterium]|nr:energy transducer TonB [Polyangiaceae bacterium]
MNRAAPVLFFAGLFAAPGIVRAEPAASAPPAARGVVTKPPKLTKFVGPTVPDGVKLEQPVAVQLEIAIGADGKVSEANVLEGSGTPELDEAAKSAALGLEFEPAEIDGAPAPVRIKYRYDIKPPEPVQEVANTATFAGTVLDQKTKQPLSGVKV